ncbi:hypothetical protein [Rubrolithibacter danxiaensis]|uniref:hypothetical protein n=1 Tax=Rubrolithibacter danxiaensis TaxID=3390805 RepID=UPI003BF8E2A1
MIKPLFRPFDRFTFNQTSCFLSGENTQIKTNVFPKWLIEAFDLEQKPIKLLDEGIVNYSDILLPASEQTLLAMEALENEISAAALGGYKQIKEISEIRLFQWICKWVYGMIHFEIRNGLKQQRASGEAFNFSQTLIHKFSNLHLMLQSLIRPVEFEGVKPWSILVFPVNNPENTFSYRDEINTLTFSLRMKDFGIIGCLQDNGANKTFHKEMLGKLEGKILHPIQFEEVCGRFFYSSYLFNRLPDYTILPTEETIFIESMLFYSISGQPLFDAWQNKTYGQVLENFWKPWGYSLFEIIKDPENPLSFLFSEDNNFIPGNLVENTLNKV